MPKRRVHLIFTCEHGGRRVPAPYASLFRSAQGVLTSHRGHDPGALELARRLARHFRAPLYSATVTRLLVELNRSPHHPALFSEFTRDLPAAQRAALLARHYLPYRDKVESAIAGALRRAAVVVHISVHSFAPVLHGEVRRCDVGLLYDPARTAEAAFCTGWRSELRALAPKLVVRRNYPYRGNSDGFTTHLRRLHPQHYLGIELEVNQKYPLGPRRAWLRVQSLVQHSLDRALDKAAAARGF